MLRKALGFGRLRARRAHSQAELDWSSLRSSYAFLIRQCEELSEGKHIHSRLLSSGHGGDIFLSNLLIQMYGKCGSVSHARRAFDLIPGKNVFSWTILITVYAQNGKNREALLLFKGMQQEGIKPTQVTMVAVFGACSNLGKTALAEGRRLQEMIAAAGFEFNLFMENTLISMYGKCGSVHGAKLVFDRMRIRDVVSWTAAISAYAQWGHCSEAIELFYEMQSADVEPTEVTYAKALTACCSEEHLEDGKRIHLQVGIQARTRTSIGTSLVIMYLKCGSLQDAKIAFDEMQQRDVVCWNALMAAYTQAGDARTALKLLRDMHQDGGASPNEITFSTAISACSAMGALSEGKKIHDKIAGAIFEFDEILGNTLISFYGKCGSLPDARDVFYSILRSSNSSIVSWNAMIAVCNQHEEFAEVLLLFRKLDLEGLKADETTLVGALDACSSSGQLRFGRQIHDRVAAEGLEQHPIVGTALVDLYGKAGKLEEAQIAFDKLEARDAVTWSSLLTAYSKLGRGSKCMGIVHQMSCEGVLPNEGSFVNTLAACSHAGMVREAWNCFNSMESDFGVEHQLEHCGCMIDMLGRAGRVEEMEVLIRSMKAKPDLATWTSMLSAANLSFDIGKGMHAASQVLNLEDEEPPFRTAL